MRSGKTVNGVTTGHLWDGTNGEYFDAETGFIYLSARYMDPQTGRFVSEDPVGDGVNWYVYANNDPIKRIDPSGLKSYIYTSRTEYYIEDDWGFWEFLNTDHYYVEINGSRYEANGLETVELYDWDKIETNFLNETLDALIDKANEEYTGIIRILTQSIGGDLDFKLQLDEDTLYLANGVLYNKNEAGNFVWAYFLESHLVSGYASGALAQGGSLAAPFINMNSFPRLDEDWDRRARWAGIEYFYERNEFMWLYTLIYKNKIQY